MTFGVYLIDLSVWSRVVRLPLLFYLTILVFVMIDVGLIQEIVYLVLP